MLDIRFSEYAYAEMQDAIEYYNLQQEGLGVIFQQELKNAVDRIAKFPMLYSISIENIRKCILHKFPYMFFYIHTDEIILVLSVAHQHRKPFYWLSNAGNHKSD